MRVTFCAKTNKKSEIKKPNKYLKSTINGALVPTTLMATTTLVSALRQPDTFKQTVKEVGGKAQYAKNFLLATAIISGACSLLNVAITYVAEKTKPSKNPKAAN